MKNKSFEYLFFYFLIYVLLVALYGLVEYVTVCKDMQGYECNLNQNKLISFLTVVAYVLTPAVAIIGFQTWKEQHNKSIFSSNAREILVILNQLNSLIDEMSTNFNNTPQSIGYIDYTSYHKMHKDYKDISTELEKKYRELYELTLDENIKKYIDTYHSTYEFWRKVHNTNFKKFTILASLKSEESAKRSLVKISLKKLKQQVHSYIFIK